MALLRGWAIWLGLRLVDVLVSRRARLNRQKKNHLTGRGRSQFREANTGGKAVLPAYTPLWGLLKLGEKDHDREIIPFDLMLICGVNEQNF